MQNLQKKLSSILEMSNLLRLIKLFFKFQRHHWIQTARMHRNHFKVVKSLAIVHFSGDLETGDIALK